MSRVDEAVLAVKVERERRKTLREERIMRLVCDPQVMGLLTLLGGLYAAQRIPYSDDPGRNDMLRGIATSGVVLAALGRSGIGGWPAVAAAGVSGAVGSGATDFLSAQDAATFLLGSDRKLFGIPIPGIS